MSKNEVRKTPPCLIILGLLVLLFLLMAILPQFGRPRYITYITPRPLATSYSAFLYCPDCAEEGMSINIWRSQDGTQLTGGVVASYPHGTSVTVIARDGKFVKVEVGSVTGWLASSLVRK